MEEPLATARLKEDVLEALEGLHKQATTERSHYYVASVVKRAIHEIEILRATLAVFRCELGGQCRARASLQASKASGSHD